MPPADKSGPDQDQFQNVPAPRIAEQPEPGRPSPGEAGPEEPVPAEKVALTERELLILAFESKWWKHAGSKEQAIRDSFGISSTRYYQVLNGLLDNPAALEQDPVLIGRLRRLRSTRARTRRR
jgi:Protein of unknown function (DUF3263)